MGVFALVMASLSGLIRHTIRFYNTQVRATEVEQQAIQATRWLSQELGEGSIESIANLPAPESAVVFGSPRDKDNLLQFDNGVMLWQKFVCYYVDKAGGTSILKRGVLEFGEPAYAPPPVPDSITISTFQGTDVSERVMARHIENLKVNVTDSAEIEIKASLDDGAYTLKLTTRVEMVNTK